MLQLTLLVALLLAAVCGSPFEKPNSRVWLGGQPVDSITEFPYQVSVRDVLTVEKIGSGAILNARWIITSARITKDLCCDELVAVVGSIFLDDGGTFFRSTQIVNHPDFDYEQFSNGIGLIQTQSVITMTENVQPIPLASSYFGPGVNARSSGWGDEANPNRLHVLTLTALTNADCRNRLPEQAEFIHDHTLCMLAAPGSAICERGNPLVTGQQIFGVHSWDASCDGTLPSMHERISFFRVWIESIIELTEPED